MMLLVAEAVATPDRCREVFRKSREGAFNAVADQMDFSQDRRSADHQSLRRIRNAAAQVIFPDSPETFRPADDRLMTAEDRPAAASGSRALPQPAPSVSISTDESP
ncbi:MAG: hypothetical protein ACLRMJ_08410 [Alistipes finegoldii]